MMNGEIKGVASFLQRINVVIALYNFYAASEVDEASLHKA